jgi:tol-pal system protein YbgF
MNARSDRTAVCVSSSLALVGLLLAGCATQTATQKKAPTLEQEIAALKGQVEELKRSQEATAREFAVIVLDTRSVRDALSQLTRRQEEGDRLLRAVKETVDGVSAQVAKLAETRAPPAPPQKPSPSPAGADALYKSAVANYRARDFYGAISSLTDFLAQFPDHQLAESAQHMLGESYYALQEFELALGEFLKLLEHAPKGAKAPEALLKVGLCYRALGDAGEARNTWERLIREHPRSAEAKRARSLIAEGPRQRR